MMIGDSDDDGGDGWLVDWLIDWLVIMKTDKDWW